MRESRLFLLLLLLHVVKFSNGQIQELLHGKSVIDTAAINNWMMLHFNPSVSSMGGYVVYSIQRHDGSDFSMHVKSTKDSWELNLGNATKAEFLSQDNRLAFLRTDTLFLTTLRKVPVKALTMVASFRSVRNISGEWLLCQLADKTSDLAIYNVRTNKVVLKPHVKSYNLNELQTSLLIETETAKESEKITALTLYTLSSNKEDIIWITDNQHAVTDSMASFALDSAGIRAAFITSQVGNFSGSTSRETSSLWYFKVGMESATLVTTDTSIRRSYGLCMSSQTPYFTSQADLVFFSLTDTNQQGKNGSPIGVDVWNYKDSILQEVQLANTGENNTYSAYVDLSTNTAYRVDYSNENVRAIRNDGNYWVVRHRVISDRFWEQKPDSNYLVSHATRENILLPTKGDCVFYFSPDNKYLLYYDTVYGGRYISYNISKRTSRIVSPTLTESTFSYHDDFLLSSRTNRDMPVGIAGWCPDDSSVLVYDNYDVWKLSLDATFEPRNLTAGFGHANHVKFRLADESPIATRTFSKKTSLLLVAFDMRTKYNGFFKLTLSDVSKFEKLYMGAFTFYRPTGPDIGYFVADAPQEFNNGGMLPLKASQSDTWILMRSSATESPNLYVTSDFKRYRALTNVVPQSNYKWLTSELLNWTRTDSVEGQGVLYKPEDFDPQKKYPVIITYYTQMSHRVFDFPPPDLAHDGEINIPWFVSRGYLVFTPDIYTYSGEVNGAGAATSIESARVNLCKYPYVDSSRIGIAGHSHAGAATNYIITHTKYFKAALSGGAGHDGVDLISNSMSLIRGNSNELDRYEREVGTTLWQNTDLWVKASPIFYADRVTTPTLIFYNKLDNDWPRAVELFIALRRLDKKVWMLQYDNYSHQVYGWAAKDFTIRITQFFDYFLKDFDEPIWMRSGIPANKKGIEFGY